VVLVTVGVTAGAPTDATPMPVMGAWTQVFPTAALLVWVQVKLMVIGPPPDVAALLFVGVTVCVIAPVVPSPLLLVVAVVVVVPWVVLLALGDTSIVKLQPLFELLAEGDTVMVFPETDPVPVADGLLVVVELPPVVVLVVVEFELAVAAPDPDPSLAGPPLADAVDAAPLVVFPVDDPPATPLLGTVPGSAALFAPAPKVDEGSPPIDGGSSRLSLPLPLVAVAVAGPPVVVAIVLVEADAPELDTVPVPVAVKGAVTLVAPTVAELPCVVVALMVVGPPLAVAALLLVEVTVWMIGPLLPSHSDTRKQWRRESAVVSVTPNVALLASGLLVMVVGPFVFQLVAFGVTVSELRSTAPMPKARGFECTVALPP
jgi:hypothetical protein